MEPRYGGKGVGASCRHGPMPRALILPCSQQPWGNVDAACAGGFGHHGCYENLAAWRPPLFLVRGLSIARKGKQARAVGPRTSRWFASGPGLLQLGHSAQTQFGELPPDGDGQASSLSGHCGELRI